MRWGRILFTNIVFVFYCCLILYFVHLVYCHIVVLPDTLNAILYFVVEIVP